MNRNMRNDRNFDELEWLAFCYISNELDDESRIKFEVRLAEDQATRDAIVQAMELTQLLDVSIADENRKQTGDLPGSTTYLAEQKGTYHIASKQRVKSLLVAAAALLLVAVGMNWYSQSGSEDAGSANVTSSLVIPVNNASPNTAPASDKPSAIKWVANAPPIVSDVDNLALAWVNAISELKDESDQPIAEVESFYTEVVFENAEDWMFIALTDLDSKEQELPIRKEGN